MNNGRDMIDVGRKPQHLSPAVMAVAQSLRRIAERLGLPPGRAKEWGVRVGIADMCPVEIQLKQLVQVVSHGSRADFVAFLREAQIVLRAIAEIITTAGRRRFGVGVAPATSLTSLYCLSANRVAWTFG